MYSEPIRPVARGQLRCHLAGEILHLGKSGLIAAVLERAKEILIVVDQMGSNWRGDRPGPNWSSNDDEIIRRWIEPCCRNLRRPASIIFLRGPGVLY